MLAPRISFRDFQVTDLTAIARGASFLFPGTRTVLDIGGQTMKASRIDGRAKVISHLSEGVPPEDIMFGAILSLTDRSLQLMKRNKLEPEYTLIGGILRWEVMAKVLRERLGQQANVPEGDMPQFTAALGCAILSHLRLRKLFAQRAENEERTAQGNGRRAKSAC